MPQNLLEFWFQRQSHICQALRKPHIIENSKAIKKQTFSCEQARWRRALNRKYQRLVTGNMPTSQHDQPPLCSGIEQNHQTASGQARDPQSAQRLPSKTVVLPRRWDVESLRSGAEKGSRSTKAVEPNGSSAAQKQTLRRDMPEIPHSFMQS